jgi:hypothetical protein
VPCHVPRDQMTIGRFQPNQNFGADDYEILAWMRDELQSRRDTAESVADACKARAAAADELYRTAGPAAGTASKP